MRGLFLGLVILMVSVSLFSVADFATTVNVGFRVISENEKEVLVEFVLPDYQIDEITTKNGIYNVLTTETQTYSTEVGLPYLPIFGTGISVPNRGKVTCEVIDSDYSETTLNNIFPSQKEGFVYENITLEENNYSGFFPLSEMAAGDNFILRDYRVKPLQIRPFRYDKNNKTLRIYTKLTIKISTDLNREGYNELNHSGEISSAFHNLYQASILNYHREASLAQNSNLLFIYKANSDPIFQLKFDQYTKYKSQKGFNVLSVSTADIGSSTSSGIKAYIQNLYNGYLFKPDFIILVGDTGGSFGIPTFNEYYADNAEGDYPYTHLAGNDFVGDVFIGRMSINNSADLSRYVGKLKSYERITNYNYQPYLDNMLLVADTEPSGESTINHCKFVRQISERVNPDYNFVEIYGGNPSPSEMNVAINSGVDFFIYRGYISMSGWSPSSSQTNMHKLNHGVMITCSTGNFSDTATTESYVNQGSETSPTGGVTAIGMATSSTHTSFNNSLSGGIFHGIYNMGQRTMGEALLSGKVNTHIVYNQSDLSDVKKFSHWCNLIGDPTVDVYTGEANHFNIERSELYLDSEELIIVVKDQNNAPIGLASVTLTKQSGVILKTQTNNEGVAIFVLDGNETEYTLTVNKPNFFPLQESISVLTESDFRITACVIDDDNEGESSGNNNQYIEAGETIELNFMVNSLVDHEISNLHATLAVNNFQVSVLQNTSQISLLPESSSNLFDTNFLIQIENNIIDNTDLAFNLDFSYGFNQTKRLIATAKVHNGKLILTNTNVVMIGNNLQANQNATISATVQNIANLSVANVTAKLVIDNGHFNVAVNNILIPQLTTNQNQTLDFRINSDIDLFAGMTAECVLKLDNEDNFYQEIRFSVKFGNSASGSPIGPDNFGYVIYDSNDLAYPDCPVYNWLEIAPNNGGAGTLLDIYDPQANGEGDGVGSNSTETINLPFQYLFYGESYNQITVCSNGFISFGANSNGEFRNWRLPGALGPNGMIAAFWDDLQMANNSGIYSYYNSFEDYFVIQWEHMINGAANHPVEETFQIILYNPQRYPSSLNQGTAKIQYKVFNNVDNGNPGNYTPWHGNYATIGIESPSGIDGLEYTYNQNYPAGAHQITNGMALFITTKPVLLVEPTINISKLLVSDENNNGIYEVEEEIEIALSLVNSALTPLTNTSATITCSDSRVVILSDYTTFADLTINEASFGSEYFKIKTIADFAVNEMITLNMEIVGDGGYHFYKDINLKINKPSLRITNFIVNDYSAEGNNNFIPEQGETLYLAWDIENSSLVDGFLDSVTIASNNPSLNFLTNSLSDVKIKANSVQQVVFQATVSALAPLYELLEVILTAYNDESTLENTSIFVLNTSETFIDFEADDVPITYTAPWQIGTSNAVPAHSSSKLLATNLNSSYPNNTNAIAWTEYLNATPTSNLTFWHRYATENNYDGGHIILNVEGSQTNSILTPQTSYSHQNISVLGGPGYSGNLNQWTLVTVNIPTSYMGQSVRYGFRFASDYSVNNSGWFIDDVTIGGTIQESFVFNGTVDLIGGEENASALDISFSNYSLNPYLNGEYLAILPLASYDILYSLPGYRNAEHSLMGITDNIMSTHDIALNYLNTPLNLRHTLQDSLLTLLWDYDEDLDDELTQFIVEEKFNTGPWEVIAQVVTNDYSYDLDKIGTYSYRVKANYQDDFSTCSSVLEFDFLPGTDNENTDVALVTALHGNYPNPFNPETNIAYTIAKPTNVKLKIYNLKGQLVKNLLDENQTSGNHKRVWNGKNNQNKAVASGIYFIRIETADYTKTHKAVLLK